MSGKSGRMQIEADVLGLCYVEAAQAYPEEACGLLIGPRDRPLCDEIRPCKNQQNQLHALDPETYPRDAHQAYSLSARDVLYLDRSLSGPRPVKIIYHSHVDVGAYFSAEDRAAALVNGEPLYPVLYLVMDCGPGGVRGARLFRFTDGDFVEVQRFPGLPEL